MFEEEQKAGKFLHSTLHKVGKHKKADHENPEMEDESLKRLIQVLEKHRLCLKDVEPDIPGRAYEDEVMTPLHCRLKDILKTLKVKCL